jgi:hypothetical protein
LPKRPLRVPGLPSLDLPGGRGATRSGCGIPTIHTCAGGRADTACCLSLNLWDIASFDGRSYHPNGITIIKLPKSILIENGGKFTNDEVINTINQQIALGVTPIIKYY